MNEENGENGDKVADDYADFWDGTWDSRTARNESGEEISFVSGKYMWTGSKADGTKDDSGSGYWLGAGAPAQGEVTEGGKQLARGASAAKAETHHLYALSPVFAVAGERGPGELGLHPGRHRPGRQSFRVLFISSDSRAATSDAIGDYNGVMQGLANTNATLVNLNLQLQPPLKAQFRAVGSTHDVHARKNTATSWTPSAQQGRRPSTGSTPPGSPSTTPTSGTAAGSPTRG